jgi:hypothetical protein
VNLTAQSWLFKLLEDGQHGLYWSDSDSSPIASGSVNGSLVPQLGHFAKRQLKWPLPLSASQLTTCAASLPCAGSSLMQFSWTPVTHPQFAGGPGGPGWPEDAKATVVTGPWRSGSQTTPVCHDIRSSLYHNAISEAITSLVSMIDIRCSQYYFEECCNNNAAYASIFIFKMFYDIRNNLSNIMAFIITY